MVEYSREEYEKLSDAWFKNRMILSGQDARKLLCEDVLNLRLRSLLSGAHFQQQKLLKQGDFLLGYTFKEWANNGSAVRRVWVLHSPSMEFSSDISKYREIHAKIQSFVPALKEDKRFLDVVRKPLSDAFYLPLPEAIRQAKEVFLSIVELPFSHYRDFKLGGCYLLARRSISKRLIVFPDWLIAKMTDHEALPLLK